MIALSFNTGHMSEERMKEFLGSTPIPGQATFFCTDKYRCLDETDHEVGIHPALAPGSDWMAELKRIRDLFPDAVGYRAHSCLFSHTVAEWLQKNGFQYVSVHDNIGSTKIDFVYHPWGVWHLPIYYLDTLDFSAIHFSEKAKAPFADRLIHAALNSDSLFVFTFHPIHVMLNTPHRDHYFKMRDRFKGGEKLSQIAFDGDGARTFLERLCRAMEERGVESLAMKDCLRQHVMRTEA